MSIREKEQQRPAATATDAMTPCGTMIRMMMMLMMLMMMMIMIPKEIFEVFSKSFAESAISKVTKIIENVSWEPTWSQLFCTGMGFRRCDMHNTPCLCRKVAVEGDWALKAD